MKHAFLISAHHEFDLLKKLLLALDDARNDIYLHIDKKVTDLPKITLNNARLFVLDEPIDIRWGDVSQIKSEFILFEAAYKNGPYKYYHTLSGVDFPLKSQDYIHAFFEQHQGKEFIGYTQGDISDEIDRKVKRIHLFPKYFRTENGFISFFMRMIRYVFLRLQFLFGIRRNRGLNFKKGTSWVSITHDLVSYLLPQYKEVMGMYNHSYCADEIFLHTICWNSMFKESIFDKDNEHNGCMRMIGWKDNQLIDWENKDFDILMKSDALFARKFNSEHIDVVHKILNKITTDV